MNMVNSHFPTIFGALVIFAAGLAGPAGAADEIDAAKVAVCSSCHGANGTPSDPKTIPIIWGQQTTIGPATATTRSWPPWPRP
jgi:cytochrome c553